MQIYKTSIYSLFALFLSLYSYTQSIDPSLLENLSPAQIELAKAEIVKSNALTDLEPNTISESLKVVVADEDANESEIEKYGYNFFNTTPTSITAVGDLPLPNDYKISLNDQFTIILSGSKEAVFDLNVKLNGTILFPELGSISVAGETFKDVKDKLRNLVEQSYIGVQIDISLKNLSAKKVTIVGAVKTPGTYLVNPFSTISSALGYSGGISEIGTLRNIRLIRTNGQIYNFDLYKLLINGDRSDDITIESGDVIIIDAANQFITLSGQIKRPAIYEIKKDETLGDLIEFGLGFTQIANISKVDLNILDKESISIRDVSTSDLSFDLLDVLSVNVNTYINKKIPRVSVGGAIKEPGLYDLGDNDSLAEFINDLEFVDVYPWLAILTQFDEENLVKNTILFSLQDAETYESIKLLPNSSLFFANLYDREYETDSITQELIKDYELTINHKQGTFKMPVYGKYSVSSFIDLLGLDMNDVSEEANYISPLNNLVITDSYKNMEFVSSKYSTITFRSPSNDLISVSIDGAIEYPGTYTLQSNASLQDLYKLIGNFKAEAFADGITFTRESIRERQIESINRSKEDLNIALLTKQQNGEEIQDISTIQALTKTIDPKYLGRIAGDYSPESSSTKNTILADGDSIYIPRNPYAINVLGAVLNPIAFEYKKGMSVDSAVIGAGGYLEYADKRRVYIIRANGLIERPGRNIFVRNIALSPGDSVIVPRKFVINTPLTDIIAPITQILSDIAFSAAAIESLSNTN